MAPSGEVLSSISKHKAVMCLPEKYVCHVNFGLAGVRVPSAVGSMLMNQLYSQ